MLLKVVEVLLKVVEVEVLLKVVEVEVMLKVVDVVKSGPGTRGQRREDR